MSAIIHRSMTQRKWIVVTILAAVAALFYFARATNLDVSAGTVTLPIDSSSVIVVITLIAVSTFVSEDLTCIGSGVMVAQGRISFATAAFACFLGIFVGDVLLFFAGRYLGRPALRRAPLKWFIRAEDVEKSSAWFTRRGVPVILASRFVPGSRLPTYFAAGLLNTNFWWFSLYFLLAGAIWSPLLVGLSKMLGAQVIQSALLSGQSLVIKIAAAAAVVFTFAKLATAMSSYRGRRLLVSRWRRWTRWEFWPVWVFYPPVICHVVVLALKHRSATLFTAVNPAIPSGGFIGESKIEILKGLSGDAGVARASLIEAALDLGERIARAKRFIEENELDFPVVLKPDEGQRGSGVAVVRSDEELKDYLNASATDTIIQEYVAGSEFGVFYYRHPDEERGRIFSITEKRFPVVTGNGASTLERLILEDERAVCMHVPRVAETREFVAARHHCRGAEQRHEHHRDPDRPQPLVACGAEREPHRDRAQDEQRDGRSAECERRLFDAGRRPLARVAAQVKVRAGEEREHRPLDADEEPESPPHRIAMIDRVRREPRDVEETSTYRCDRSVVCTQGCSSISSRYGGCGQNHAASAQAARTKPIGTPHGVKMEVMTPTASAHATRNGTIVGRGTSWR